ncbi:MAG TPA: indole-3-glycerol phosphate synthase TrpC [Polyangia bacterium]
MILDDILAETKRTVGYCRFRLPLYDLEKQAETSRPPCSLSESLRSAKGMTCIAEFKRRSPSKGWIHRDADVSSVVSMYEAAGAAAASVLTDTPFFGGSLDDLRRARATARLPLLRKDFIVDPYQVVEARAAGADAVLLIVAALRDEDLRGLLAETARWGLEALVETHDADEVDRAVAAGARIIGVNHRDLRTFDLNMDLAVTMRPLIPDDRVVVAESGIRDAADVRRLRAAGIDAILVGETLMRAPNPAAALRELVAGA